MKQRNPPAVGLGTDYRIQRWDDRSASASLFIRNGLPNEVLLQVLRLSTGTGDAYSVFGVYRDASMTFEVSARLDVAAHFRAPRYILRGVLDDKPFLDRLFNPMLSDLRRQFKRAKRRGS